MTQEPGLRMTRGKKVFEVRPNVPWNKGKALLFLLEKLGITRDSGAVTLYIGDDITDEDAFEVSVIPYSMLFRIAFCRIKWARRFCSCWRSWVLRATRER